MIRAGEDVHVVDHETGDDLTTLTLTQIILERHPERMKLFPAAFLHAILRADQLALNWLTLYFSQAMTFMDRFTRSRSSSVMPGIDFFQSFMPDVGKRPDVPQAPTQPTDSSDSPDSGHAQETQQALAAKLAEMELRLKQLEGASPEDGSSTPEQSLPDEPSEQESGD